MALPSFRTRDVDVTEIMDADCDPATLERTYRQFRHVNALISGWRQTYRTHVRPQLSTSRPTRLLDVGSGGGDLPRALVRWAILDGLRLEVVAIDPDPRAHAFATSLPRYRHLEFRQAFTSDLVAAGETFDLVTSNHMLHHLTGTELGELLADSGALLAPRGDTPARGARRIIHSDITRSAAAYVLFGIGPGMLFPGSYIRADGLTSIRRSFTPAELRAAVPPGWRVEPQSAFRYLLTSTGGRDV
jgi:2-polyprenyl-3-methyl-5-hydroxy-6-metoxy-1,4-benzoquinol methylase